MSSRTFTLLFSFGCAALTAISWVHSWPALAEGRPWADLGGGRHHRPWLDILEAATFAWLFALYVYVLVCWRRFALTPRALALMGLAPALLTLAALPANSNDVLFYLALGRILVVHGANPYTHSYSEFPDEFTPYFGWDETMPYGPVALPPLMLGAWVSTASLVGLIFVLKLVWLLVHLGCSAVIYDVLRRKGADATFGLFLFGFSPLILLEQLANGHNDGLMILFILLAIAAVQRGHGVWALLLALCATFVKIPGAMAGAVILVLLLRQGQWRRAAVGSAACVVLVALAGVVFFRDRDAVMSLANPSSHTTNSLHHLLIAVVAEYGHLAGVSMSFAEVARADRLIASVLLLAFCIWRAAYVRNLDSLIRELAYLFLALLVGHTAWFFPWYVTWLVPLAALTTSEALRWTILGYSGSVVALYGFPRYLITQAPFHQIWAAIRISSPTRRFWRSW